MNATIGLTGRVLAEVINNGQVVASSGWTRNLWLDRGLDQAADTPICDLFAVAVKGTGTNPTSEDLTGTANTYSIANGSFVLTRAAGTRDFTSADIGKLLRFSTTPFAEFHIVAINSATSVEVTPNASAAVTTKKITLYSVQQEALDAEIGRTDTYSATPGENSTTTAANARTFKRTFLFDKEDTLVEYVDESNTFSQTGTTITRESGSRDFSPADEGATIEFVNSGNTAKILVVNDDLSVSVDEASANEPQPIIIRRPNAEKTEAVTGTYSRAGSTVTRVSGTRDFDAGDVGKIMRFNTTGEEVKITVILSATTVTVDDSGAIAAQAITLYGFTDYREIGFSHTLERADNINIRVVLASPVRVYVATVTRASDQLKLTYECRLTVTPSVATTGNLLGVIVDPGNLMSGNKQGKSAIETFATSMVDTDGQTDISLPDLEPFYEGFAALSLNTEALEPLAGKVRSTSTAFVEMVADPYVAGTFSKTFQAIFGLNDAVSNAWRSLMIYDPDSQSAIFTYLFNTAQRKDGEHTLQVGFRKAWNRDLS